MGAYITNDDFLLHGHQVTLQKEYDNKCYMLSDGTFKDDHLHHGIEYSYDFSVRTVRMVIEDEHQNMFSESEIAQISARGGLDDAIHSGLIGIDVGVWNSNKMLNDCYYGCITPDPLQSFTDDGPFQHMLQRRAPRGPGICSSSARGIYIPVHGDVSYSSGPWVQEGVWRLQ